MFRQVMKMAGTHFLTNITIALVGLVFLTSVVVNPTYKIIFTVIAAIIYAMSIYSKAWEFAGRDKKTTTETEVSVYKGPVLPLGAIVISALLLLGYLFAWRYLTIDGTLATATAFLYNAVYVITTFTFSGILGLQNGSASVVGHIVMYIIPIVASTLGYIAGMKGFTIGDKLLPMMYEKKKK